MLVSAVITAAGKNSRMERDQISRGIPVKNKLTLPLNNKTIIQETIDNVVSSDIDECIVVVGHHSNKIKEAISNNYEGKVKIILNNPVDVGLSTSLFNGLQNINSKLALCVTGDQPTISTKTFNNLIKNSLNSKDPFKTISILRRKKVGLLDTAEGLGMPFVAPCDTLKNYLKNKDENLNPILRKIHKDGFKFFGIKEENELELLKDRKSVV